MEQLFQTVPTEVLYQILGDVYSLIGTYRGFKTEPYYLYLFEFCELIQKELDKRMLEDEEC